MGLALDTAHKRSLFINPVEEEFKSEDDKDAELYGRSAFNYATLAIRRRDNSMDETVINSPVFSGIALPYLSEQGNGSLVTINYGHKWNSSKEGEAGSASLATSDIPYRGYAGKTVTLKTIFDSAFAPPILQGVEQYDPRNMAYVEALLNNWCMQYTGKSWRTRSSVKHRVFIKKQLSPKIHNEIVYNYLNSLKAPGPDAPPDLAEQFKKYFNERGVEKVEKIDPIETEELALNNDSPLPPPPLVFKMGPLVLDPCVLLSFECVYRKYTYGRVLSMEVTLVIQELPQNRAIYQAPALPEDVRDAEIAAGMPGPTIRDSTIEVETTTKFANWDGKAGGQYPIQTKKQRDWVTFDEAIRTGIGR